MAKRQVPELTFDIYGEGSEKTRLRKIIDTHRAQDIRLLGHVKLDEIYNDYELFLSASTSEGFGLTLDGSGRLRTRYDWIKCELW